jgi:hypothetical protein
VKLKAAFFSLMVSVFVTACVSFTPEVPTGQAVNPEKGYVFGRFNLRIEKGVSHIALNLESGDGKNYALPLKAGDDVYAVCLAPGTYRVASVHFLNESRNKIATRAFETSRKLMTSFELQTGDLFYIGDYQGMIRINGGESTFALESVNDRYNETLGVILKKHGNFGVLKAKSGFQ